MKKSVILKVIIIFLLVILFCSNIAFAKINTNITIKNDLINEAEPMGNKVVGALLVVGTFIAVIMTMVVGIRYMLCSVEEKAEYKKTAIIYITGAILIFGATGLVNLIYNAVN